MNKIQIQMEKIQIPIKKYKYKLHQYKYKWSKYKCQLNKYKLEIQMFCPMLDIRYDSSTDEMDSLQKKLDVEEKQPTFLFSWKICKK